MNQFSIKKILSLTFLLFTYVSTGLSTFSYADSEVKLKRKVAIARFTNETQSGASFLMDDSGDRIGKQASDILSARLIDKGYFLMFESLCFFCGYLFLLIGLFSQNSNFLKNSSNSGFTVFDLSEPVFFTDFNFLLAD